MYYVKVFHIEAFMRLSRVLTVFFFFEHGVKSQGKESTFETRRVRDIN